MVIGDDVLYVLKEHSDERMRPAHESIYVLKGTQPVIEEHKNPEYTGHPHGLGLISDGLVLEKIADFAGCDIVSTRVNRVVARRKWEKVVQTGFCNVSG